MSKNLRRTLEIIAIIIFFICYFLLPNDTLKAIALCAIGVVLVVITFYYILTNTLTRREFKTELIESGILAAFVAAMVYVTLFME